MSSVSFLFFRTVNAARAHPSPCDTNRLVQLPYRIYEMRACKIYIHTQKNTFRFFFCLRFLFLDDFVHINFEAQKTFFLLCDITFRFRSNISFFLSFVCECVNGIRFFALYLLFVCKSCGHIESDRNGVGTGSKQTHCTCNLACNNNLFSRRYLFCSFFCLSLSLPRSKYVLKWGCERGTPNEQHKKITNSKLRERCGRKMVSSLDK